MEEPAAERLSSALPVGCSFLLSREPSKTLSDAGRYSISKLFKELQRERKDERGEKKKNVLSAGHEHALNFNGMLARTFEHDRPVRQARLLPCRCVLPVTTWL